MSSENGTQNDPDIPPTPKDSSDSQNEPTNIPSLVRLYPSFVFSIFAGILAGGIVDFEGNLIATVAYTTTSFVIVGVAALLFYAIYKKLLRWSF